MTPQQEQTLRLQARARGYDQTKENAYIEFVRQKESTQTAAVQPAPQEPQGDGFWKSAAKDPLKTLVVKPATRIAQSIVAPYGIARSQDISKERDRLSAEITRLIKEKNAATDPGARARIDRVIQDTKKVLDSYQSQAEATSKAMSVVDSTQNVNLPVAGDFSIESQKGGTEGIKQVAGDALKTASYLFTPGKVVGSVASWAKAVAQPTVRSVFSQAGRTAVNTGTAGAVGGGAYSAGSALEQNKSAAEIALDTLTGAAVGFAGGAVLGGGGSLLAQGTKLGVDKLRGTNFKKSLVDRQVKQLESTYDELFTGRESGKKQLVKSKKAGKNPSKFLAENGYIVGVKNGKIDAQPVIQQIEKNADAFENVFDSILKEADRGLTPDRRISLRQLGLRIKSRLNSTTNKASGNLTAMNNHVDDLVGELINQFGETVDLSTLNSIKRSQWTQSRVFDASKPKFSSDINYNAAKAAKDLIEQALPDQDIRTFNNYLGDHYDAIKNLSKPITVKGGRLGGYFARTVGAIAGAKAGPFGALLGAEAGDAVSKLMQNTAVAGPIKKLLLSRIPKTSPLYNQAQDALQQLIKTNIDDRVAQKALPKGDTIFAGPKTPPQGAQTKVLTPHKGTGKDPLTGKFKRVFKSTGKVLGEALDEITPGLRTKQITPEQELFNKAKKYPTAEEFVKAQGTPVYHGGEISKLENRPLFTAVDDYIAKSYDPYGKLNEFYPAKNIKELDITTDYSKAKEAIKSKFDNYGENYVENTWFDPFSSSKKKVQETYDKYISKYKNFDAIEKRYNTLKGDSVVSEYGKLWEKDVQKAISYIRELSETQKEKVFEFDILDRIIKEVKDPSRDDIYANWKQILKYAKDNNYDSVKHITQSKDAQQTGIERIFIDPTKSLKTKSQLTDIWKKANASKLGGVKSSIKKIDLPTKQEMVQVIDYVKLKQPYNQEIEQIAGDLADKYGIQAKTLNELANEFIKMIENTGGLGRTVAKRAIQATALGGLVYSAKRK